MKSYGALQLAFAKTHRIHRDDADRDRDLSVSEMEPGGRDALTAEALAR